MNRTHKIELVCVIEAPDEESPYLLEADGQTPPEDVDGISGFNSFHEIMLDPEHKGLKEWEGFGM